MGAATGLRPAPLLAGVAAAGVLVATVMTGPDAGAEVRTDRVSVDYTCALPTGTQELTATLVQNYPTAVTAGGQIQPGPLTVRATVPRGLLPAAAASVSGTAALGVAVADTATPATTASTASTASASTGAGRPSAGTPTATGSTATVTLRTSAAAVLAAATAAPVAPPPGAVTAQWTGLTVAPVPLGAANPTITATGQVTALTAGRAGATTTVTPMALSLSLQAGGSTLRFQCVPARTPTPLGSIAVLAAPSARAGTQATAGVAGAPRREVVAHAAQTPECSASPTGTLDPADLPTHPAGSMIISESSSGVECAYAIGYANVAKLGEASLVNNPDQNPSMALLAIERLVFKYGTPPYYVEIDEVGNLTLPVADTTFLSYGFMPTTAKMQLIPVGNLTAVETGQAPEPIVTTIYGEQTLRLYDVAVDGTPLDVGSDCRTVSPLKLQLNGLSLATTGNDPDPTRDYTIPGGGPLSQNDLTIPYFTGCGPNGSLDPLFDAAVSGAGNSLNLVQGAPCFSYEGACTTIQMPELPVRAPKTSK